MTTLCLCDWVETKVDRERRLALSAAPLSDSRNTNAMAEKAVLPITPHQMARRDTPLQPEHLS